MTARSRGILSYDSEDKQNYRGIDIRLFKRSGCSGETHLEAPGLAHKKPQVPSHKMPIVPV